MMEEKSLRVLICDDEPIIAMGIDCCLKELGHQTAGIVKTGKEALAYVEKDQPDLILMDINIPEMDGISVMQRINSKYFIPCIFITGYSDRDTISRAQSKTTYGYLIKPVDVNDLNAAINVAVTRSDDYLQTTKTLAQTKNALLERKIIERAKGVLMDEFSMKEADAMRYMQRKSRDTNRKILDIADEIIKMSKRLK